MDRPYREDTHKSLEMLRNVHTQPPRLIPAPLSNSIMKPIVHESKIVKVAPRLNVFYPTLSNVPLASNVKAMSLSDISRVTQPQKPLSFVRFFQSIMI